jgi:AhpC/TSA family
LAEIGRKEELFRKLGSRIVAVSADDNSRSESFRKELGFPLDLLCDVERKVIRQYHLLNKAEHGGIAFPAIFIIKSDGTIGYRSLDRTASRVDLSEVISYLENLAGNPDFIQQSESSKSIVIPSPKNLFQFGKNMLLRGSLDDWKHHLLFPYATIKLLLKRK